MRSLLVLTLLIGTCACSTSMGTPDRSSPIGAWMIEYIEGRPVIDNSPAYIEFTEDGKVAGQASCNRFMGGYERAGATLSLGPIAATRMICPDALMDQEDRFLAALGRVARFELRAGLLFLLDANDETMIRASRKEH